MGVRKRGEKKGIFRERDAFRGWGQRRWPGGGGEVSAIAQTSQGEGPLTTTMAKKLSLNHADRAPEVLRRIEHAARNTAAAPF